MVDQLKVYVDRLREGAVDVSEGVCPADFLNVDEGDVQFSGDLAYRLESSVAEDELVLALSVSGTTRMPCATCNELTDVPIVVKGYYHAIPLAEVKSGVYDATDFVRETFLLEIPNIAHCGGESCCHRELVEPYLRQKTEEPADEGYKPFEGLEIN